MTHVTPPIEATARSEIDYMLNMHLLHRRYDIVRQMPMRIQLCFQNPANTRLQHMLATCRWALGVLIYEMVAGYPPFYSENKVEMFKVHW